MKLNIENSWLKILENEMGKKYFQDLIYFVKNQYVDKICYPPSDLIFSAFNHCSLDNIKVVIIGQDPYHGPNQANGLCFSVNSKLKNPPSLINIFKEISENLNCEIRQNGNLLDWSKQGVLLLNSVLTVEKGFPGSHSGKGWEIFTDYILKLISTNKKNVVFILWGVYAKKKENLITKKNNLILKAGHPSPLSAFRGHWFGNKHFIKCNDYLVQKGLESIKW